MIAIPAIDLRGDRVVQLVGGRPETECVSLPDPVAVALRWIETGFGEIHVVDLDAALGSGHNRRHIQDILSRTDVPVQVGGGVRDTESAEALLEAGAARVIVGTRAIEDRPWLEELVARHPARIIVAADVRDGEVVTRGWTAGSGRPAEEFMGQLWDLDLAGVLVTDVGREGRMTGIDTDLFSGLRAASKHKLYAAGGIAEVRDLHALASVGAHGAIMGMALYTGGLDPEATARQFGGAKGDRSRGR